MPGEACFYQGEAGLHKEHQETGEQHPHDVNRIGELGGFRPFLGEGDAAEGEKEHAYQQRDRKPSQDTFPYNDKTSFNRFGLRPDP